METKSTRPKHSWRPRVGWGVPVAWLTLCVVWSSTWLVIKIGLRDLPPISYAATRFVLAVIVLVAIGLAAVLQATIPIFGMVFAHLMLPDEPLRLQKLVGAFLALGGVTIICERLLGFNGLMAFWGGLGIVFGAAGAAFSNVLLKARVMQLAPAMIAAWQMIFGVVPLLVTGFIVEGNPLHFHWSGLSIFCLLYLAVIGSALTFLLLYWLLPRMTVANLQAISLITPPGAVALGWAIGGEKFSLWSLLGASFVLAGVWMIFRKGKARVRAAAREPGAALS